MNEQADECLEQHLEALPTPQPNLLLPSPQPPCPSSSGPLKRRRTSDLTRNITSYMKNKRERESELKLKTLELEIMKERNESRRIALQEQQMTMVTTSLNKTVEVLNKTAEVLTNLNKHVNN
uniref:DNA topoisomerase 4 subunit B n=1 Tax=Lygus hesperus TaxID=30085 RepID=A0A0A9WQ90_LYGHE